ncbi:hypothetical protein [Hymenobacter cavernae]|uniref:Lipocalin-like domain-containing protein n=1 Tax=Hymenobacter cavernae TaxID=2044852 RepID=A0ABQ1UYT1_9BACT|nr:hypothetical protein [Hymenobacter cavernae]GGF28674.1 hypothetical protein GCM10011383_45510 [Hymenobacter cavernae]
MPRLFSFLLCSLLLTGIAACHQNDPEPTLQGSWTVASRTYYYCDQAGKVLRTDVSGSLATTYRAQISADTIAYYAIAFSPAYRESAQAYTRQGDKLRHPYGEPTQLRKLTGHTLVLFNQGSSGAAGTYRIDYETTLTR